MAALVTRRRTPLGVGTTRSRWCTTCAMLRSRSRPMPITSHTTCSAGSLRRRTDAVSVAASASLRVDRCAELLETRRALAGAHGKDSLPHLHRPTSCGGDQVLPVDKKIQNAVTYALSD